MAGVNTSTMNLPAAGFDWNPSLYAPTYDDTSSIDFGYWYRPSAERVTELVKQLKDLTEALSKFPYHYRLWRRRSAVFEELGYPELSVHDAYKSLLLASAALTLYRAVHPLQHRRIMETREDWQSFSLCRESVVKGREWERQLCEHISSYDYHLGRKVFKELDAYGQHQTAESANSQTRNEASITQLQLEQAELRTRERLIYALRAAKSFLDAKNIAEETRVNFNTLSRKGNIPNQGGFRDNLEEINDILDLKWNFVIERTTDSYGRWYYYSHGSVKIQRYPWMPDSVIQRPEALVQQLAAALEAGSAGKCTFRSASELVQPLAGSSRACQQSYLGTFARRAISEGELIVADQADLRSMPPVVDLDLDRADLNGVLHMAYSTVLYHHLMDIESAMTQAVSPLVTSPSLNLAAGYRESAVVKPFSLPDDSIAPVRILEATMINPFADNRWDGWVLQEIRRRIELNAASASTTPGQETDRFVLYPLYVHINHSCDPNTKPDTVYNTVGTSTLQLVATKDIEPGTQLTVSYDHVVGIDSVAERRQVLKASLGGDCQCMRCRHEEQLI